MFYLACTRFNNFTYEENIHYRNEYNEYVIYGTPLKIRNSYPCGSFMFIAEMNNETNKIQGIGLIKNSLVLDRRHKIYENNEYNRYIYRGKYWLSREQIDNIDSEILEIFDNILFKGKSHLKRRIGITVITENIFVNWDYHYSILKNKVKNVFLHYFQEDFITYLELKFETRNYKDINKDKNLNKDKDLIQGKDVIQDKDLIEDKDTEIIEIIPKKRKRLHKVKNIEI